MAKQLKASLACLKSSSDYLTEQNKCRKAPLGIISCSIELSGKERKLFTSWSVFILRTHDSKAMKQQYDSDFRTKIILKKIMYWDKTNKNYSMV